VVLVISTFKVANGMETEVRRAFLDRPGLVDDAPGFLGMEVLVDHQDGSIFHLVTRWRDEESFERWHSGPLHDLSHRGIPKGLKLDPSYTAIRRFTVLPGESGHALIARLPQFLARSSSLHWLKTSLDGRIIDANPAFELLLHEPAGALAGQLLWQRLTKPDAEAVEAILKSADPDSGVPLLLNFVDRDHGVHTLKCHLEVHGRDFVVVGEPAAEHEQALANELLVLNNRWALLVRENEKNVKALRQANEKLEKALSDLNESHWHLRKIQETLPICMYCGKVRTGEAHWEGVVEYLKKNSLFLSHGCCPNCVHLMDERC
jgi:heme-degrading monooxygenase HmoA